MMLNPLQIKVGVEALEHIKDEESKRFKKHKNFFDFNVLIHIKESMVDVSSRCIALTLEVSEGYLILVRNQLSYCKVKIYLTFK